MSGFKGRLNMAGFKAQRADVEERAEAAVRPAAQAGAQVLYEAVLANVRALRKFTGNLEKSIYQAYSSDNSGEALAVYHVSWNKRKAPHGHLVEFGYLQRYEITYDPKTKRFVTHTDQPLPEPRHVAAKAFVRSAISSMPAAYAAAREELYGRLHGSKS